MFPALSQNGSKFLPQVNLKRGAVFGFLIVAALLAFEMFNYSTTEYSLTDLLGELEFMSIRWATILAIAFCTIDFAGLARLFTPEQGEDEPVEVWYLFGAWLLASIMNAMLTWWGVSVAIVSHDPTANTLVSQETVLRVVPVFVAMMVFLIRVLIIGTFTVAGDRLFSQANRRKGSYSTNRPAGNRPVPAVRPAQPRISPLTAQSSFRAAPKPVAAGQPGYTRPEPSYHPLSVSGAGQKRNDGLG